MTKLAVIEHFFVGDEDNEDAYVVQATVKYGCITVATYAGLGSSMCAYTFADGFCVGKGMNINDIEELSLYDVERGEPI